MIPFQHTVDTPYMVGPVHFYTIDRGDELILIDTGPPTETGRDYLRQHLDLGRLGHVLVTHCHVDHYGQASWLAQHSDAAIYLPRADILKHEQLDRRLVAMIELFEELGFDDDYLAVLHGMFTRTSMLPPYPEHYRVADSDLPARLGIEARACPGHSQSDLVFVGEGWAVTGDTLLRGVFQSPLLDVDLDCGGRFRNYEAYCRSLVTLAALGTTRILPGHRHHVESVDETLRFYLTKMLRRVSSLLPHLGGGSVARLVARMFPSMKDPFHVYLKASEIVFMMDFLERPELLSAALEEAGLMEQVAELFRAVAGRQ